MQSDSPTITAISKAFGVSRQTYYEKSGNLGLTKADWLSPEILFSKMLDNGNASPFRRKLSDPATRALIQTNIQQLQ